MSEYSPVCRCPERQKPIEQRDWHVLDRGMGELGYNGRGYVLSEMCAVDCWACGASWYTRAKYVMWLRDFDVDEFLHRFAEQPAEQPE